ncbi:MAG: DegT/DnrJ/EryC1/StrS family aminotransferase [Verrucomicrobiales bacterium]
MPVPLLDVNAQNHPLEAEFTEAFLRVFRSGQFIMGQEVTALETALAELTGSRHCLGISSGTDAILLALMALDIGPGDEVLVPTFTFFATAGCVSRTGATPVFVDACPVCFNLDVEDARAKLTSRTRAIIPVHLFGQSADMDPILALAGEHGLRVIEDAAQSLGAGYRDRPCGSLGDFGTYSFFPSKNLGGFGDAGALVCQDDALAERARILRNHGSQPKYYHHWVGGNFRLDPLQAAMLRVKLPHYGDYTARRQANAAFYTEHLGALPGVAVADPAHCRCRARQNAWAAERELQMILPVAYGHHHHIWNQYTLRLPGPGRREALKTHLQERQIGCEIYYPLTLDQQPCFAATPDASRQGCETAHQLATEVLSLPVYPEMSDAQKHEVVDAVAAFLAATPS